MNCIQAVISFFLLAPCEDGGGESFDTAIAKSLASPDRLEQDRDKDSLRHPDQVLAFFEIEPGCFCLHIGPSCGKGHFF